LCGIIGYVGSRASKPLLLQGLARLEYRGYDSAGIALLEEGGLDYVRAVGNLQFLKDAAGANGSVSTTGLGHTRWATHGGVTEQNAHPLTACDDSKMAIVLNGIVENYRELREDTRSHRRPTRKWWPTCSRTPTTAISLRPCEQRTSGSKVTSPSS
jgi:glucosamine--fructose-6-phosphate aminotransferase (isomerizing)